MQIPPKFGDAESPPPHQNTTCKFMKKMWIQLKSTSPIHIFCSTSMSSLVEKAKDELQAFLEILIPSARSLKKNIEDQKALIKVKL